MMILKKIFLLLSIFLFSSCVQQDGWYSEYIEEAETKKPTIINNDFSSLGLYGTFDENPNINISKTELSPKNISVLLPQSGTNSNIGKSLTHSIELALLLQPNKNISVNFYDLSGNIEKKQKIIKEAISNDPDIILGPIFAEDAKMVRDIKPIELPVLSFTSDSKVLGDGIMTMTLIPSQSVEYIVKEISRDLAKSVIIFAPNNNSGKLLASVATVATSIYDVPLSGLFYYDENNSDSIKLSVKKATMYDARLLANNKAREILSDILIKENLSENQKELLNKQLEKLSKSETLGKIPYDAILFLGNANDSKTIASFLRYFNIQNRDAKFYGTINWDDSEVCTDFNMSGSKFATLPKISDNFSAVFEKLTNRKPSRLDTFAFDAVNLIKNMPADNKKKIMYLLDPSGYKGIDGLFKLKPNGENERTLQIVETTGNGKRIVRQTKKDFIKPIYSVESKNIDLIKNDIELVSDGINPMDYIDIPENLRKKYKSKIFGANTKIENKTNQENIIVIQEDANEFVNSPEFQPTELEQIDKKLIDSVEVKE